MCGFSGIVHWERESVESQELSDSIGTLRHRGPDEMFIKMPTPDVGLAHTRLRVIDLSPRARQPMAGDQSKRWLLYNGEVYNFLELRKELQGLGHSFRSESDTEVLIRAYEAWGVKAFSRLEGMFALAIWDVKTRELILARDRVGKKPLFYWTDGTCITFGSEIKSLLAHTHVPREIDEEVLPFLAAFGHPPTGRTAYRGIKQVHPATFVRFKQGDRDPMPTTYWHIQMDASGSQVSADEAVSELRYRLMEAVRKRVRADVPLGAFLSGGVDSSIIVGLMRNILPKQPLKTFSIGFEGDPNFNETHYAEQVARRFDTDHTAFTVTTQSFDLLERLVWHHDQPFGDSSAIPTYLLSQRTKEHVTVVLTGDGGDEVFGGYTRFPAALWAEVFPRSMWKGLNAFLQGFPASKDRSFIGRAKRFSRAAHLPLMDRYLHWAAYCQLPNGGGSWSTDELSYPVRKWWSESQGWTSLSRLLYLNFKEYLPNDLMVKTDRCSMAHGLEARSPFLDTSLIEYGALLPDSFKVRGWKTKVILKEAFEGLLPPAISRRRKMGFGVPLGAWLRGAWRQPLQDLLTAPGARISRYVDRSCIQRLIQEHLRGRCDAGHPLWFLLTFEVWLRQLEGSRTSYCVGAR